MNAPTSIEAQAAHDLAQALAEDRGDTEAPHHGACWCCCWDCDLDYEAVRAADAAAGSEEV